MRLRDERHDRALDRIRILVLVDKDVEELFGNARADRRILHHPQPVDEQVVKIHRVRRALAFGVCAPDLRNLIGERRKIGMLPFEHVGHARLRIERER